MLELTDRDGVRTLALNRPDRFNALDAELLERLPEELERAAGDGAVRVVVVTGRGRAFCAGGDLDLMADGVGTLELGLRRERAATLLREMGKPTVAVNGVAAGAGFSLALAADLRVAGASARFTPGFGAVGLCGDYGGSYTLPRLVGRERALRLYFLGETWDAARAERYGLVGSVVADGELEASVAALGAQLAAQAPRAMARMKANFCAAERLDFDSILRMEAEGMIPGQQRHPSAAGGRRRRRRHRPDEPVGRAGVPRRGGTACRRGRGTARGGRPA
ncbi:MAG TPA: enoyl-CoA hydratase-related protein, partial [Acidimicrobiia bacterium]|nr:enoyl-CoA hydratase-related protein [Acidimicrobiia bacterium]